MHGILLYPFHSSTSTPSYINFTLYKCKVGIAGRQNSPWNIQKLKISERKKWHTIPQSHLFSEHHDKKKNLKCVLLYVDVTLYTEGLISTLTLNRRSMFSHSWRLLKEAFFVHLRRLLCHVVLTMWYYFAY